jgi:hypothetical protein
VGYGELGGGGSVHWRMRHGGSGGNGNGNANGGNGRDPKPSPAEGGTFTILVNGAVVAGPIPIDFGNQRQIEIIWSPDTVQDLDRLRSESGQQAASGGGNPHAASSAGSRT